MVREDLCIRLSAPDPAAEFASARGRVSQALDVVHGWRAERAAVFAAELGGASIADLGIVKGVTNHLAARASPRGKSLCRQARGE